MPTNKKSKATLGLESVNKRCASERKDKGSFATEAKGEVVMS